MDNSAKIITSFISSDLKIKGNVISNGKVILRGHLNGNISAKIIALEVGGKIVGNIKAENTEIMGHQKGNISSKNVSLTSDSKMRGNITCENLNVDQGADIGGRIESKKK